MNIGELLKEKRGVRGLSQVELSHLTGVSLPMIQLIEANKGNPSLKIIQKLLSPLTMSLEIKNEFNWNDLIHHGAPLLSNEHKPSKIEKVKPTKDNLIILILEAFINLKKIRNSSDYDRKKEILRAMSLTLKTHYPSLFKIMSKRNPEIIKFSDFNIEGKHIKLKRIILQHFKDYL